MMLFGLSQPMFTFVIMLVSSIQVATLSIGTKTLQQAEVEMSASSQDVNGPPRPSEFTQMGGLYHIIEKTIRKHHNRTTLLQEKVFQEKRKTVRTLLRKIAAGQGTGPADQVYGSLAVVAEGVHTPVAVCLPQASSTPWLRLLMRMQGNEQWNDLHDRVIKQSIDDKLFLVGPQKVNKFYSQHADFAIKSVVVRDPVTRVLFNYLDTCRREGLWTECMSDSGSPISFPEMVNKLAGKGTAHAPEGLRQQLDACALRNHSFDLLGWHEDLEFSAQNFLRTLAKWNTIGDKGWGDLGDAKFSDIFPMDNTHNKVCDFYTPELLRTVQGLYADDFKMFGYDVNTWSEMCAEPWAAASKGEKYVNKHTVPTPGKYQLPSYHKATTCAPTSAELHTLASGQWTNFERSSKIKFYIHEQGGFDFNGVLACFLGQYGISLMEDNWDDQLPANVSEHLGEAWLLKALRSHPQRTMDPFHADLHVIGALPFISYMASQESPSGQTCGTMADHEQRMADVAQSLLKLDGFQATRGRNFFIFTTHFRIPQLYTDPLLQILNRGHVLVGTADIDYTHWKAYPNIRRKVVLPYKTHYLVDKAAFDEDVHGERDVDFLFRGKISRSNEGSNRETMKRLMNNSKLRLDRVDVQDVKFIGQDPSFSDELAEKYTRSRFCLAPAGDTPTSRRLFDALAGGCVPVALGDSDKLVQNLPFTRTIDWTKLVFYGGSLPCVDNDMEASKDWFSAITEINDTESSMRSAGQEAYQRTLSYARNGQGLVTAMLTEITHLL